MNLVFDGPAEPIRFQIFSLFALLPLVVWTFERYLRKRSATIMLPAISIVAFVGINGIQVWDHWRIGKLVASGQDVRITRGAITQSWHIETRHRDWTKANLSYKTIISEGFDVAGVRFSWNMADSFSAATFSNGGAQPITFQKGEQVEVTWFIDPAAQDSRRILRLRKGGVPVAMTALDKVLGAFHDNFVKAFTSGDTATLSKLTRKPFRFGEHDVDADASSTMWMALIVPGLQTCVSSVAWAPVKNGGAILTCDKVTFVFRKDSKGEWQFTEARIVGG